MDGLCAFLYLLFEPFHCTLGLRKPGDMITKNSSKAQFSCTSVNEQGVEEGGCTKDFRNF